MIELRSTIRRLRGGRQPYTAVEMYKYAYINMGVTMILTRTTHPVVLRTTMLGAESYLFLPAEIFLFVISPPLALFTQYTPSNGVHKSRRAYLFVCRACVSSILDSHSSEAIRHRQTNCTRDFLQSAVPRKHPLSARSTFRWPEDLIHTLSTHSGERNTLRLR